MATASSVAQRYQLPAWQSDYAPIGGPVTAVLGDSITENGIQSGFISNVTRNVYQNVGFTNWVRFLSQGRVYLPQTHMLGIGGQTFPEIAARLPSLLTLRPQPHIVVIQGGSNDIGQGITLDKSQDAFLSLVRAVRQQGLIAVVMPILPRNFAGIDATKLANLLQFNNWQRRWVQEVGDKGIIYVDLLPVLVDATNANGDPLAALFYDGLHPNVNGAYRIGKAIVDALDKLLPPGGHVGMHPADVFGTTNPQGNIIRATTNNRGMMVGTGGSMTSQGSCTASGSAATGFTITRQSAGASATCTLVGAKQNPRTDGPTSGERQSMAIAVSVAGGAAEIFTCRFGNLTIGGANDVQPGDVIEATAKLEIAASAVGLLGAELQLSEFNGIGVLTVDMARSANSGLFPTLSTPVVGLFRTPRHTVRADSPLNTTLQVGLTVTMDTTQVSAAATLILSDLAVRKVTGV